MLAIFFIFWYFHSSHHKWSTTISHFMFILHFPGSHRYYFSYVCLLLYYSSEKCLLRSLVHFYLDYLFLLSFLSFYILSILILFLTDFKYFLAFWDLSLHSVNFLHCIKSSVRFCVYFLCFGDHSQKITVYIKILKCFP